MTADDLSSADGQVSVVVDVVTRVDVGERRLTTSSGRELGFDALCVCVGAVPKVSSQCSLHAAALTAQRLYPADWAASRLFDGFILTIRDTESVEDLSKRLSGARRVLVAGSGGVAMEFVHAVRRRWID